MKVTFQDKRDLIQLSSVKEVNKITAEDINSVKEAINTNDDAIIDINRNIEDINKTNELVSKAITSNTEKINTNITEINNAKANITINTNDIKDAKKNIEDNKKAITEHASDLTNIKTELATNVTEVGSIIPYLSKTNLPKGYLLLNGQPLLKSKYSKLYSIIGDKYGSTDASFYLPDQNRLNNGGEFDEYYYIIKAE